MAVSLPRNELIRELAKLDYKEMTSVYRAAWRARQARSMAKMGLVPGDSVRFLDRSHELVTGTVLSVNIKTVSVAVEGTRGYRVAPALLEKVS